jgi:hypothetical protein
MDERKPPRPGLDDDVPIIGDYSEAADARLRAERERREGAAAHPPATRPEPHEPPRRPAPRRPAADDWALDPGDVRRHAQRIEQRDRKGPLGRLVPYALAAAALAAAVAVYLNFETLRGVTLDTSALENLFRARPTAGTVTSADDDAAPLAVEAPAIAGADVPADEEPAAAEVRATPPAATAAADADGRAAREPPASAAPVAAAPPAAPEPPPGPESFGFGVPKVEVSEAAASAAVLILRSGDRRRASTVTWWTKPGSATPGEDYADLGKVAVKFAAGEQNRTIHIPIVSDHRDEGPETFYVYLATDDAAIAADQPTDKVEVVIDDRGGSAR